MKQDKRMSIYYDFCERTTALMFCTDIAARGLDFPNVDWVVQFDCPEDVPTYIHRVGRTARYRSGGKALLFLLPSEMKFIEQLTAKKVVLKKVKVILDKIKSVTQQFQSLCIEHQELKYLAQKSLISYLRSIYLQTNKDIFNIELLPIQQLAECMGLNTVPKLKILKQSNKNEKNMPYAVKEMMKKVNKKYKKSIKNNI
jgi:ATP-dependent RNA helicase DDX10/DBP4